MVEMVETAAILNQAASGRLVILDEIGRGTATYDGLSIAWAALEHLHEGNRCRTLFATHFHEMTALAERLSRLSNVTMRVKEWEGDVVFLHEGGTRCRRPFLWRPGGPPRWPAGGSGGARPGGPAELEEGETTGKAARIVDEPAAVFGRHVKREQPAKDRRAPRHAGRGYAR